MARSVEMGRHLNINQSINTVMKYQYQTQGTCSKLIDIEIDPATGLIADVRFTGGCNGNLQGIGLLVKGMKPSEVIDRLKGVRCGNRPTSCPDQLACALVSIKE